MIPLAFIGGYSIVIVAAVVIVAIRIVLSL